MRVHVADHPLIAHKLTTLRDERTDSPTFRRLAEELVTLLAYEATREVRTEPDNPGVGDTGSGQKSAERMGAAGETRRATGEDRERSAAHDERHEGDVRPHIDQAALEAHERGQRPAIEQIARWIVTRLDRGDTPEGEVGRGRDPCLDREICRGPACRPGHLARSDHEHRTWHF